MHKSQLIATIQLVLNDAGHYQPNAEPPRVAATANRHVGGQLSLAFSGRMLDNREVRLFAITGPAAKLSNSAGVKHEED